MAMSILCLQRDFHGGGDHGKVWFVVRFSICSCFFDTWFIVESLDLHLSETGLIVLCTDSYFEDMGLYFWYLTLYFVRIDLYLVSELILLGKRDLGPQMGPRSKSGPGPNGTQAQTGPGPNGTQAQTWPGPNGTQAQTGPGPNGTQAQTGPGPNGTRAQTWPGPNGTRAQMASLWFWVGFIEKHVFICGKWVGMTRDWPRMCLGMILVLGISSKVYFGSQNLIFLSGNLDILEHQSFWLTSGPGNTETPVILIN